MRLARCSMRLTLLAALGAGFLSSAAEDGVQALAERAVGASDSVRRLQAIEMLGRVDVQANPQVIDTLLAAVANDSNEDNRVAAIQQLLIVGAGDARVIPAIERLQIADRSLRVRQEATLAVYHLRNSAADSKPSGHVNGSMPEYGALIGTDFFNPGNSKRPIGPPAGTGFTGQLDVAKPTNLSVARPARLDQEPMIPTAVSRKPAPASSLDPAFQPIRPSGAERASDAAPGPARTTAAAVNQSQRWEIAPRTADSTASTKSSTEEQAPPETAVPEAKRSNFFSKMLPWNWYGEPAPEPTKPSAAVATTALPEPARPTPPKKEPAPKTTAEPAPKAVAKSAVVAPPKPAMEMPADPAARKELSKQMLAEARRLLEAGQIDEAEAVVYRVKELAVDYGRFEDKPSSIERDIEKARRNTGSVFPKGTK